MRFRLINVLSVAVIGIGGVWSTAGATESRGPGCNPQDFCWDTCPALFGLFCSNRVPSCGSDMAPESYCTNGSACADHGGWLVHCVWAS